MKILGKFIYLQSLFQVGVKTFRNLKEAVHTWIFSQHFEEFFPLNFSVRFSPPLVDLCDQCEILLKF